MSNSNLPPPTDLPTVYVKPGPELLDPTNPYPQLDFSYESGFPDSPYGDYSYFYDYYLYECGVAEMKELSQHLQLHGTAGGDPMAYLSNCAAGDRVAQAMGMGANQAQLNSSMQVPDNRKFSGGALTPFRGLKHYQSGNGETMSIDIEKIQINQPLGQIKDRHSNQSLQQIANSLGTGVHPVSVEFPYDTASSGASVGLTLGNITLKLAGTMVVNGDGTFTLDGEFRGFNDRYDGGAANRGPLKEFLTRFIQGGTPYEIQIEGAQPVRYDSTKPNHLGTKNWMLERPQKTSEIKGSPSTWDVVYIYYDTKADGFVARTGENTAVIVRQQETVHLTDIKQVVFRDDFFEIPSMPIIGGYARPA